MPKQQNASGHPLTEPEQNELRRLRDEVGDDRAPRVVGVSAQTFARAAAGFGLQRGTRLLIRVKLAELGREAA